MRSAPGSGCSSLGQTAVRGPVLLRESRLVLGSLLGGLMYKINSASPHKSPSSTSGHHGAFYEAPRSVVPQWLVSLDGRAAGAELLRFAARVFKLGAGVGVDELAGLDPLEPVTL
jgi:hypothetical protein